tara:strand:+ start:1103 stop:1591 length:489 start_codon:yes stop_codon:yes gene_type:complete
MSIEEQESERRFSWRWLVWKFDNSPTREVIDSLHDMATELAVAAERLDIDSTPMVVAANALRRARAGAAHTEDLRASLDAVELVLGRFLFRRISKLPPSEAAGEVAKVTKAQQRIDGRRKTLREGIESKDWRSKGQGWVIAELKISVRTLRDDLTALGIQWK